MKKKSIWTEAEREAWKLPEKMTVSQWADKNRVLSPLTSAEPGRWKTVRVPYLRGVMDSFTQPGVDEITLMAASQVGKTEAMFNMIGYIIDQDPGPALYVSPREPDAKSISFNRVLPMIQESRALSDKIPKNSDYITKLEYRFDRMLLFFSGSNSPASLASRPIRYLFLDEVDKYPAFSGKEADPIKLASERQKTFWNKMTVKVSTPTTEKNYIYREYKRSNKSKYYVPCPYCGHRQTFIFSNIKWPEGTTSTEITDSRLAWYECAGCQKKIHDWQKDKMLELGEWVAENKKNKSHFGFWINSIYSPWLSFSDVASEFLKSKDDVEKLMNFVNSWLAETFKETVHETKESTIRGLEQDHAKCTVPSGALVLTAGIDVQKDHFYMTIRGWGYYQVSWQILSTRCETWEDVVDIVVDGKYQIVGSDTRFMQVTLAMIDSAHRTSEVYDFCRERSDIFKPIKGKTRLMGTPVRVSTIDSHPDGRRIPGGLRLYTLDTSYFKDKISRLINNSEQGYKSAFYLHKNPSDQYIKQMHSEHKVPVRDKRTKVEYERWEPISSHAANHFWDCEVYAAASAEVLRVHSMRPPEKKNTEDQNPKEPKKKHKWIGNTSGWVSKK